MRRMIAAGPPSKRPPQFGLAWGLTWRSAWFGTVAVCYPLKSYLPNFDAEFSALWGPMFVFGDPEIIRRLTGRK